MSADGITMELSGIDEVLAALNALPAKVQRKLLYDTNRDILKKIVLPDVKSGIPYSARTRRGIKVVRARGTDTGSYVGVTVDAYWLRFLEFGTEERVTRGHSRRASVGTGRISPRPTVVSTIEGKINDVLKAVQKEYDIHFVEALTRHLRKFRIKKSFT